MTNENAADPVHKPVTVDEDDFPILELILRNYLPDEDILRIRDAYSFAEEAHRGQKRESGEPYIIHPLSVAEILAEFQLDADTVIAGLLHDTIEDTPHTYLEIKERFGESVANMVQGVTKVNELGTVSHNEATVENLRRMLLATAKDLHVIIIKVADRLHNMRTLQYCPRAKQIQIARDTLSIYAPLAHRLGLGRFKWELEDLSLMYLNPDAYRDIKKRVQLKRREREQYIAQIVKDLDERIQSKGIRIHIEGRAKHFYSIYKKMLRDNKTFEEIYDLIAVRVLCETIGECYAVLGEVHTLWRQMEGRFKDYISTPKPNNYRSIHTTVLGPFGRMIEIQIRTQEMHFVAEHGVAAHWRYKEQGSRKFGKDSKWLELIQNLPDTHDPEEFLQSIRSDLFSDEVYVYTPKGQLVRLPQEATPIDFAYKIHTELGHRCGGAKVNGRMIPLNHPLKTGDVVEVLASPNSHPSPAWLDIVKTASARNKIRRYLLESKRDELHQIGYGRLTRELQKAGFSPLEFYNTPQAQEIAESLRQKNLEELFINIGFGRIAPKQILARLIKAKAPAKPESKKDETEADKEITKRTLVRLGDIDDILYRRALCCNPLPGDDITGFVTRGRGVTIHKSSCTNLKHYEQDPGRVMSLFWQGDQKENVSVSIEITARDRRNLLSDLSQMISSTGTNILGSYSRTENAIATFVFSVEVNSTNHLNTIMQQLLGIEGVRTVKRLRQPHNPVSPKAKAKRTHSGNGHSANHSRH